MKNENGLQTLWKGLLQTASLVGDEENRTPTSRVRVYRATTMQIPISGAARLGLSRSACVIIYAYRRRLSSIFLKNLQNKKCRLSALLQGCGRFCPGGAVYSHRTLKGSLA